ncbi:MAG: diguanylate cyclase [Gemmatimonadetes bacterium]|uniref:diguanylate cyclase n=1 Tax=Candidatus Kutchimonas denitrificans TaxID=3056748 RepID=A0AAE4ZD06_9BACT|nr:diguanylate cyclase [Gemmatimonadota bacterium]NIR76481.1 diguanylate cyclase [Candidatus Kutchimonas denitrificans]NIS03299.1 diguanylate cyclase [Gemmatimonadota bacterium]NIT69160.1 diguanylate cyclase [Gemmatimonadota bacterium]NIU54552.1 diguanylate cyclase [Gemmatimonadota bacterium]
MSDKGFILLGRDGPEALAGLEEALAEDGYAVRSVRDGNTLLSYVASQHPDLVLIDESIAEMAPLEIVKHVRHRVGSRDVPILLVSSQTQGDDAATAIRAGVTDYIRKPFQLHELIARIWSHLERGRLIRHARREADTNGIVLEVVRDVTASLSSEEIFDILVRRVSRLFNIRRCSMILIEDDLEHGTVVAAHDDPSISALAIDLGRYPEIRQAVETGAPVLVKNLRGSALFEQIRPLWETEKIEVDVQSIVAIPFTFDQSRAGVFFLRSSPDEPQLDEESVRLMSAIAQGAVRALNRAAMFENVLSHQEQLEILAKTDELTGCLSRRYLMERLENELERAARYKRLLGLVIFDIDDFKRLNDTHGHTTGDAALRSIGEVLRRSLRTADFVGRYGGDEFLLVLPETSPHGTHQLAERIRNGVSRRDFDLRGGSLRLTVSGGVAGFPETGVVTPEDLIDRADQALYRAKAAGRNKVLAYSADLDKVSASD